MQDHTAESFIEMAKQRLCEKTEKRTRDFMWEMVETLKADKKHPFLQAVGYCCHPNCWWHNGKCPELKSCHEGITKLSDSIIRQYKGDCK
jgi:thymidylate synthase ThyX